MSAGRAVLFVALVATAPTPTRAADILVNGNFDGATSAPWVDQGVPGYPIVVLASDAGFPAQSAPRIAWLGGFLSTTTAIYQDVAVPMGQGTLEVTGYYRISTEEFTTGVYDVLTIDLVTTSNALLEHVLQRGNSDATNVWTPIDFHATGNYSGQTVRLRMRATNDDSYNTNFFLDTMVLNAGPTLGVSESGDPLTRVGLPAPNPSRGEVQLSLDLAERSSVRTSICDLSGRIVRTLAPGAMEPGAHRLVWDGRDEMGARVPPGAYFARVDVGAQTYQRKLVLIR